MHSRRYVPVLRWLLAGAALASIVLVFRRWFHVNNTTVALTLLLLVLLLAAEWGLRYAVVTAVAATILYNFYFLPPVGTFTVADPENWIALLAFLSTAILASRLSQRARDEASEARLRQRELAVLFRLSREFLRTEPTAGELASVPPAVLDLTSARTVMLYLLDGDRLYQAGESASDVERPHLSKVAMELTDVRSSENELEIPIRTGVRPRGLLVLRGATLSKATAEAMGSLISASMDRTQALESIARNEAAKESERLRTLMIDSITHELRTPLTSIKGAATALLATVQDDTARELLSIIDEESDRLNQLVEEAVEVAQLDAHQVQMHFRPTNVAEMVAAARANCAWVEDDHALTLEVEPGLEVQADSVVFQKVICNLLENAAKYSAAGTPITIDARREGNMVALSVADRGMGIDPADQTLIFERFYRTRTQPAPSSGTGMGLAISRAIVEAHGGQLRVQSQVGHGSVFTATVPVPERDQQR